MRRAVIRILDRLDGPLWRAVTSTLKTCGSEKSLALVSAPRTMSDAQDKDIIDLDAIDDQIGPDDREFAAALRKRPPTLRVVRETFGGRQWAFGHALRSRRIELSDICPDILQVIPGRFGPDYSPYLGGGNSLGLPHERSHLRMASWEITRPLAIAASASSIAWASALRSTLSNRVSAFFMILAY